MENIKKNFYNKLNELGEMYENTFNDYVNQVNKNILKKDPKYIGVPNINFSLNYDSKNEEKYSEQRKERGFDDSELWSLDYTIARFILPRLIRFKEVIVGYPSELTMEKWYDILDKMILAFRLKVEEDEFNGSLEEEKERSKIMQEGLDLFAKYFFNLWWLKDKNIIN